MPDATRATIIVNVDIPGPVISRHLYGHFAEHLGRCIYGGVCRDPSGRVTVLAWQPVGRTNAPAASERHEVHLSVPMTGAPCPDGTGVFMLRERVNEADGNAFAAWRELGRPMSLDEHQLDVIRRSSTIGRGPSTAG